MSEQSNPIRPSRRRSTKIQFGGNTVLMGLSIVQGVVLVPLYLRYIGKDMYGAWLATASTVALLGIADLGITGIISQRSGSYCGGQDFKSLGTFIITLLLFICGVVITIGAVGFPLAPLLQRSLAPVHYHLPFP